MQVNILMTGGSGFLGRHLLSELDPQIDVQLLQRNQSSDLPYKTYKANLDDKSDYSEALANKDIVIHMAARVHVMSEDKQDALSAYRVVNSLGTLALAKQAIKAGVKRFIFISSIKVNGERTLTKAFTSKDIHAPEDYYGASKSEAEKALIEVAKNSPMEVVVIRPPLIYGPSVKGNFASILKAVDKQIPLPFASLRSNKRSLVYVGNLTSLIIECLDNPNAANEVFLVCDDQSVSTNSLVEIIGQSLAIKPRIFKLPPFALKLLGLVLGRKEQVSRLLESLEVNDDATREKLNWQPPFSMQEGMQATVNRYKENIS